MTSMSTFEKRIEVAKLILLVLGGIGALVPWYYNILDQYRKAEQSSERPWESEFPLTVDSGKDYGGGTALYEVEMKVKLKNISAAKFDLSYSIEELYVG